jgi:hypothetical protein
VGKRCDFVNRVGIEFWEQPRTLPKAYSMHPEFLARLKMEQSAILALDIRDGRWHFLGVPIEQDATIHSVTVKGESKSV